MYNFSSQFSHENEVRGHKLSGGPVDNKRMLLEVLVVLLERKKFYTEKEWFCSKSAQTSLPYAFANFTPLILHHFVSLSFKKIHYEQCLIRKIIQSPCPPRRDVLESIDKH